MAAIGWTAIRAAVIAAPFVLHLGTWNVVPMWGSPPFPVWTEVVTFAAAAGAVVLAVHDFRAARCTLKQTLWLVAAVLALAPLAAWLLYLVVALLGVILAVPYAAAFVGMVMRVVRRWNSGREFG
jgi:hypothetical protein